MENDIDQKLKETIEQLNEALEENRKGSERLKGLSNQVFKEVEENKADRIEIEKKLDQCYFQVQQKNLS